MKTPVSSGTLDQLFMDAHTAHAYAPHAITDQDLQKLYDTMKWGPTAFNASPARFVFLRSAEAKARLVPALSAGNVAQVQSASVTVIVAYDRQFYEHLPTLFPVYDAKPIFEGNEAAAQETAFRNGTLQGAYLLMAARALGYDCGPMSGFDAQKVDAEFFPDGRYHANFLMNIGVAETKGFHPRNPRLSFEQAALVL